MLLCQVVVALALWSLWVDLLVLQFLALDLRDLAADRLWQGVAVVVELLVVQGLLHLRVEDEHAQDLRVELANFYAI